MEWVAEWEVTVAEWDASKNQIEYMRKEKGERRNKLVLECHALFFSFLLSPF
jgi:hypothetical protein